MTDGILIWEWECPECDQTQGRHVPDDGETIECVACDFTAVVEEVETNHD